MSARLRFLSLDKHRAEANAQEKRRYDDAR